MSGSPLLSMDTLIHEILSLRAISTDLFSSQDGRDFQQAQGSSEEELQSKGMLRMKLRASRFCIESLTIHDLLISKSFTLALSSSFEAQSPLPG